MFLSVFVETANLFVFGMKKAKKWMFFFIVHYSDTHFLLTYTYTSPVSDT